MGDSRQAHEQGRSVRLAGCLALAGLVESPAGARHTAPVDADFRATILDSLMVTLAMRSVFLVAIFAISGCCFPVSVPTPAPAPPAPKRPARTLADVQSELTFWRAELVIAQDKFNEQIMEMNKWMTMKNEKPDLAPDAADSLEKLIKFSSEKVAESHGRVQKIEATLKSLEAEAHQLTGPH